VSAPSLLHRPCTYCLTLQLKKKKGGDIPSGRGAKAPPPADGPRIDYTKSAAVFAKIQEHRDSAAAGGGSANGKAREGGAAAQPAARFKL